MKLEDARARIADPEERVALLRTLRATPCERSKRRCHSGGAAASRMADLLDAR
jgi:hypothetical protein